MDLAYDNDETIREAVADMVPTYHPAAGGTGILDETYKSLRREAEAVH